MNALSEALTQYRESRTPTPLATYLYIYNHASYECYINYMEGAKTLAKYLAPIDINYKAVSILPDILCSYELIGLTKVLQPHTTIPLAMNQIENAIYEYLTQPR